MAKGSIKNRMSDDDLLRALEALAGTLGVELRYEKGDFKGGLCRLQGRSVFFLQEDDPVDEKIRTLAAGLGKLDLDNVYVFPAVRELIDEIQNL